MKQKTKQNKTNALDTATKTEKHVMKEETTTKNWKIAGHHHHSYVHSIHSNTHFVHIDYDYFHSKRCMKPLKLCRICKRKRYFGLEESTAKPNGTPIYWWQKSQMLSISLNTLMNHWIQNGKLYLLHMWNVNCIVSYRIVSFQLACIRMVFRSCLRFQTISFNVRIFHLTKEISYVVAVIALDRVEHSDWIPQIANHFFPILWLFITLCS